MTTTSKEEHVNVFVRVRPLNQKEKMAKSHNIARVEKEKGFVELEPPVGQESRKVGWTFDAVFDESTTQQEVYKTGAFKIVEGVLEGYNGTVLAYGQTSAGKTYTMMGVLEEETKRGVMTNAIYHIFSKIAEEKSRKFLVRVSYMELYKEAISDLLVGLVAAPPERQGKAAAAVAVVAEKLQLKVKPEGGFTVEGLREQVVTTPGEVLRLMEEGTKKRHVGGTEMNAQSSRSHSVFQMVVECTSSGGRGESLVRQGKLRLVDLAGSERQKQSKAEGVRLKEATKINLGLMALGNVINALVARREHVPYRDSKLTELLQDSLGGNSKTAMFACISPAAVNFEETSATLRYADRAKQIKNAPKVNEDPKDALLSKMQEEIKRLKAELESGGGGPSQPQGGGGGELGKMRGIAGGTGVDPQLLMRLRFESGGEAAIGEALAKCGVARAERERISAELKAVQEEDERARREKEEVASRLRVLEQNICIGGVNLLDENARQAAELLRANRELEEAEAARVKLQQRLAEEEEARLFNEEAFQSLEDAVASKTAKAKKIFERLERMAQDVAALKAEHERDRAVLRDSITELERELQLKSLVIDGFVPKQMQSLIRESALWDVSTESWSMLALSQAGNPSRDSPSSEPSADQQQQQQQQQKIRDAASAAVGRFSLQATTPADFQFGNVFLSLSSMATTSPRSGGAVVPAKQQQQQQQQAVGEWVVEEEHTDLETGVRLSRRTAPKAKPGRSSLTPSPQPQSPTQSPSTTGKKGSFVH